MWRLPRRSPLEALDRIGRLYDIEAEIRGRPPDERQAVRQARAGPELKSLHDWLHTTATELSKKSELAKAIRYALSNWVALTRYRDDGRLEIDNNAAERALRAVALGRKNWLFAGSDDGGERAAAIYTLLGTAKLNDLDPEGYLRYVLERIADHPINHIEELLPWNLARQDARASHRSLISQSRRPTPDAYPCIRPFWPTALRIGWALFRPATSSVSRRCILFAISRSLRVHARGS